MARLERGKGARKDIIDIAQSGAVLSRRRTEAGNPHLTGYRRCADAAQARAVLVHEVQALVRDGMTPVDDEARALAGDAAAAPKKPTLPLRRDLGIYNEATGFVVTARRMAGKALEEGTAAWKKAVARGDLLPVSLAQDDPIIVRVVAGEPLTAQEDEEWVARIDAHLHLADGRLCITGGAVFSQDDYDADEAYHEQFVTELPLPKGRYRATLYTLAYGINGSGALGHLNGDEPVEAWFARTRPGEAPPDRDTTELVDVLLHLEPIDAAPAAADLTPLPADGWFGGAENARLPARCPPGLPARNVVRRVQVPEGEWVYVREAGEGLPGQTLAPLAGGPLACAADTPARAVQMAWFGSRHGAVEVVLAPPAGAGLPTLATWPADTVAVEAGDAVRLLFGVDSSLHDIMARLAELAPWFGAAPAGSTLEIRTLGMSVVGNAPIAAGSLWLRGTLHGGEWRIDAAWPATDAVTLRAALALAGEVLGGERLAVRDAAEGEALITWTARKIGPHLRNAPGRLVDGAIVCDRASGNLDYYGLAAFTHRHADTWPTVPLSDIEPDED